MLLRLGQRVSELQQLQLQALSGGHRRPVRGGGESIEDCTSLSSLLNSTMTPLSVITNSENTVVKIYNNCKVVKQTIWSSLFLPFFPSSLLQPNSR